MGDIDNITKARYAEQCCTNPMPEYYRLRFK